MRRTLVALGLLMVAQDAHAKEDQVTVRGLGPDLKLTGWQARWQAEGEILEPLLPRPGGSMLALVKPNATKALTLVSWSKEGKVLAQTTLPIDDDIVSAKVFGSKLIVATATKVVEVDETDFRKMRHAAVTEAPAEFVIYEASPMGLWVVTAEAVTHHYLDGRPPLRKLRPLAGGSNLLPCETTPYEPCSEGFSPAKDGAIANDSGELLVLEQFKEKYPYGDTPGFYDKVWPEVAVLLAPDGKLLMERSSGWAEKYREWFWTMGSGSQSPLGLPSDFGLVRTRHQGRGLGFEGQRAARGRDFLVEGSAGSRNDQIRRFNSKLEVVWTRTIPNLAGVVFSPSWTRTMLVHNTRCSVFASLDDNGRLIGEADLPVDEILEELHVTKNKRPRFAIGQDPGGDWLLIAY
jgi:hypothetical protein